MRFAFVFDATIDTKYWSMYCHYVHAKSLDITERLMGDSHRIIDFEITENRRKSFGIN